MKKSHSPLSFPLLSLIFTCFLWPGTMLAEEGDSANPSENASGEAEKIQEMQSQFDFWLGQWNLS